MAGSATDAGLGRGALMWQAAEAVWIARRGFSGETLTELEGMPPARGDRPGRSLAARAWPAAEKELAELAEGKAGAC